MDLTVLGAGPAYTDRPGATGAAYLVREGDTAILLDLGQGSFPRLAAEIEPSSLDAVVVSHLHPDHFIDLVPLRHYLRWEFSPTRRVRVLGPRDLAARLDALHATAGFAAEALDVVALGETVVPIGELGIEARLVTHTDESYAFRVAAADGRPGLVYSGDCGRAHDLVPLIRDGDTLLVEASFGPGPVVPGAEHLDGPAIAELVAATRPGRVLLTHIQMGYDPEETVRIVQRGFDGPVDVVEPWFRIRLGGERA